MGGVDEGVTYGFNNVRLGVFANTPRLMFEKWYGTNWTLWEIDHGGTGLRFYKAGETTLRVNSTAIQVGEAGKRRNAVIYGDIITIDPAGGGGNLDIDGNANIAGNITANYFIGDGSFLTNINVGLINSSSWNRSGTKVFLSNTNDLVGIGTTSPGYKLTIEGADYTSSAISTERTSADNAGPWIKLLKSRSGASANVGDNLGRFGFEMRNNNSDIHYAASVSGYVDNVTAGSEGGYLRFDTAYESSGATERMRITSAGNVGIGTTSPATNFDVAGNGLIQTALYIKNTGIDTVGTDASRFIHAGTAFYWDTHADKLSIRM